MSFSHRAIALTCLFMLTVGCVNTGAQRAYDPVARAQLLDGSLLGLEDPALAGEFDVLLLNDEMRAFLDTHVENDWGSLQKVQAILAAILDDGLHLSYDAFETHTAQEAFYIREGNCMSFTNLFVALARASGVNAHYQEVEVPPSWEEQGSTWLYNKHVNAVVDLAGTNVMVDFAVDVVQTDHRRRIIDDQAAQARYHSNMGVHFLSMKDDDQAFRHFREAILLEPGTGFFWTNLGTLYRRLNVLDAAEESFLIAVKLTSEPAAISNLARLYRDTSQIELAERYEARAQVFRRKNPFYLYASAQKSYESGDYEAALRDARLAANRQKSEPRFHWLMGMSYLRLDKPRQAQKQLAIAAELAEDDNERAAYNRKLDLLGKR